MIADQEYARIRDRLLDEIGVDVPGATHFGKLVVRPKKAAPKTKSREIAKMAGDIVLRSDVPTDDITCEISRMFDYEFSGETVFSCGMPDIPKKYSIGLIVGPSGSGKTTILKNIGKLSSPKWKKGVAVASHFNDAEVAQRRLSGVGFNSIPSWLRPHECLSTGEAFRADMAKSLKDGACIDEFTSVVDRVVAKSCSYAVRRLVDEEGLKNITFASCHYDIIEWLRPDWVYDTLSRKFLPRGSLRCPERNIELYPCNTDVWPIFSPHHYLTEDINKGARCWIAEWEGRTVGFASAIAFPNQHWKNGWREHRTVCLPGYQGMGFGVRVSDAVAEIFVADGARYFSKTAHPRMGEYRNASPLWRATSKNGRDRQDYNHNRKTKESNHKDLHTNRVTYSHEYIGNS